MTDPSMVTPCPGTGPQFHGLDPAKLLDRSKIVPHQFLPFIAPWLGRADQAAQGSQWFEALIYEWIVFNCWVAQVVADRNQSQRDSYLWQAAALDPDLNARFIEQLAASGEVAGAVSALRDVWPVFKVRTLSEYRIPGWGHTSDSETRSYYRKQCFAMKLTDRDYAPGCYAQHQPSGAIIDGGDPSLVPIDWAHVLASIYMIRCNLFHGGKSFVYGKDAFFAQLAFCILRGVVRPRP